MKFSGQDVTKIFRALEDGGVPVWLDGGWAIDALLRKESREHSDVDLIVPIDSLGPAEAILGTLGFQMDNRQTNMPTRAVFRDSAGLEVDIHPVTFNPDGSSIHIDEDKSDRKYVYVSSSAGLTGVGVIDGRVVRCTTAAEQIRQKVERRYSPWAPDRIRADGVSADLRDIISLLEVFGVGEGVGRQTIQTVEAPLTDNEVVNAAEQFRFRHVASLCAQHTELTARHAELSARHSQLTAQHAGLVEEHRALRARLKTMRKSISWRLTAPMRWTAERMGIGWSKLRTH
ncbi:nucleotidyltransferase domain-containing protein [Hyphomicrobium sp. 99]|uniref:nucleotidyltransferase domain-containing protein n=1 Tax=Hyphomicrobium sp. 99 TaxID=1163419 RepID=UPI00069698AA|nr:hypothetical protein [Hyphomicrobium sp. 99]